MKCICRWSKRGTWFIRDSKNDEYYIPLGFTIVTNEGIRVVNFLIYKLQLSFGWWVKK